MKTKLNHLIGSFCLIAALAATGCSDEHEYASDHSYYDDVKLKIEVMAPGYSGEVSERLVVKLCLISAIWL